MTTADGKYDFEYKVGAIDKVKVQLFQGEGDNKVAWDLTDAVVVLNLAPKTTGTRQTLTCDLGYTLNGESLSEADGYITVNVSSESTASVLEYEGECVISQGGLVGFCPSGDEYYRFKVRAAK
jgi:hypothetical protein